jgi:hypothetical protein
LFTQVELEIEEKKLGKNLDLHKQTLQEQLEKITEEFNILMKKYKVLEKNYISTNQFFFLIFQI